MSLVQFTFVEDGAQQVEIIFDATLSESHSASTDITSFPVENGAAVTDHLRANPRTLRIEGLITDNPLVSSGIKLKEYERGEKSRSVTAFENFERLRTKGVLCTVVTKLRTYENMALESYEVPRSKDLKGGVRITLNFKEVRTVTTQVIAIKAKRSGSKEKAKADLGNQTGQQVKRASVLNYLQNWNR